MKFQMVKKKKKRQNLQVDDFDGILQSSFGLPGRGLCIRRRLSWRFMSREVCHLPNLQDPEFSSPIIKLANY